jgi:hypothetical protein
MTSDQFFALHELVGMRTDSKASRGAYAVLVQGMTQTEASRFIECAQSTISASVNKIKNAQRLANKGAIRY